MCVRNANYIEPNEKEICIRPLSAKKHNKNHQGQQVSRTEGGLVDTTECYARFQLESEKGDGTFVRSHPLHYTAGPALPGRLIKRSAIREL